MPGQVTAPRRAAGTALVVALLTPWTWALTPQGAAAGAPVEAYEASAAADGVRQTVIRPEAPLSSMLVDIGSPSAQALVNALGDSRAYASFLYPGANVLAVPPLASGPAGRTLPGYPLIAASEDPLVPQADASVGPATVRATSAPNRSTGAATFAAPTTGAGELAATASAQADPLQGSVEASARSAASAVDIAGVLRLSSVRAEARARRGSGRTTSTSSLHVGDLLVAGARVVLTPAGLSLPGQVVPLPDTSPVLEPLRAAGISVELLPAEELEGGARSGGVRVVIDQRTPDGNKVTVTYVFGQVLAVVSAVESVPVGTTSTGPASTTGDRRLEAAPPGQAALEPAAALPLPPALAEAVQQAPPAALAVEAPKLPHVGVRQVVLSAAPFTQMDALSFYLVLVVTAAAALVAQFSLRRWGVRPSWRS